MVAKGHDFDGIALGVVLDADATLRFPDFRAEERTFALVAQLAGRAGRGGTPGRVLVQTLAPAGALDRRRRAPRQRGLPRGRAERRRALRYPPYGELIRHRLLLGARRARRSRAATELRAPDRRCRGGQLLGPAPLFRLRGRERAQIVVKAADRARAAVAAVGEAVARPLDREVAVSVDVDPQ